MHPFLPLSDTQYTCTGVGTVAGRQAYRVWLGLLPLLHINTRSPECFFHALLASAEETLGLILRSLKRQGGGEERGRGTSLTLMASLIARSPLISF